jgi:hypothetical protein
MEMYVFCVFVGVRVAVCVCVFERESEWICKCAS